jgi:hypothetical protein
MHSYRSKRPIFWLRLCALLYPLVLLSFSALAAFVVYAFVNSSTEMMYQVLYGMGICTTLLMLYFISAAHSKCPLCRSGPMSSNRCVKNRQATKVLGSYRLSVVLDVLFLNRYRCPYCGESTRLKVRGK